MLSRQEVQEQMRGDFVTASGGGGFGNRSASFLKSWSLHLTRRRDYRGEMCDHME